MRNAIAILFGVLASTSCGRAPTPEATTGLLRGRVLDAEGAPLAGQLRVRWPGSSALSLGPEVGEDGAFELEFELEPDGPRRGTLFFESRNRRFAQREVVLASGERPSYLVLRAGPEGRLQGVVRYPSGHPVARLPLLVRNASGPEVRRWIGHRWIGPPEGDGRLVRRIETDRDGRFDVSGLYPGSHEVRASRAAQLAKSVLADGEELEFVYGEAAIALSVLGNGSPPLPNRVEVITRRSELREPSERVARLLVVPVFEGRLSTPFRIASGRRIGEEYVFVVDPEREYWIGLWGGGNAWLPKRMELFAGRRSAALELVDAGESGPPHGRLTGRVHGQDGVPTHLAHVRVLDFETNVPLVELRLDREASSRFSLGLPPGTYRVVVDGVPEIEFQHGRLLGPSPGGRAERVLRIESAEEQVFEATLSIGGAVRLTLEGEVEDADRTAVLSRDVPLLPRLLYRRDGPRIARVELRSPVDWPAPLDFLDPVEMAGPPGNRISSLPLGKVVTSLTVPAGSYELRARMPGGRVARREIAVRDGETTDVTLRFR